MMSLKLYNGYWIPVMDMVTTLQWLKGIQKKFCECRHSEFIKRFPGIHEKYTFDRWVNLQMLADNIKLTNKRNPVLDFAAELVLFPLPTKILVVTFWDNKAYEELWNSLEEVHFWGYWNNADPDETCSKVEWEQRKKDWYEVLGDRDKVFSQCGFTFELTDYSIPTPFEYKKKEY